MTDLLEVNKQDVVNEIQQLFLYKFDLHAQPGDDPYWYV